MKNILHALAHITIYIVTNINFTLHIANIHYKPHLIFHASHKKIYITNTSCTEHTAQSFHKLYLHCTLYAAEYTLGNTSRLPTPHAAHIHYRLYLKHRTLHTIHYRLYLKHRTLHTIHNKLFVVHCTPHTVHCTLYIAHCTLYTSD